MSQEKVDRYKEAKLNRKETMKKEKRNRMAWRIGSCAVLVALLCWIGVSGVNAYQNNKALDTVYANTDAITEYLGTFDTVE